jgi:hypothetical protein
MLSRSALLARRDRKSLNHPRFSSLSRQEVKTLLQKADRRSGYGRYGRVRESTAGIHATGGEKEGLTALVVCPDTNRPLGASLYDFHL